MIVDAIRIQESDSEAGKAQTRSKSRQEGDVGCSGHDAGKLYAINTAEEQYILRLFEGANHTTIDETIIATEIRRHSRFIASERSSKEQYPRRQLLVRLNAPKALGQAKAAQAGH